MVNVKSVEIFIEKFIFERISKKRKVRILLFFRLRVDEVVDVVMKFSDEEEEDDEEEYMLQVLLLKKRFLVKKKSFVKKLIVSVKKKSIDEVVNVVFDFGDEDDDDDEKIEEEDEEEDSNDEVDFKVEADFDFDYSVEKKDLEKDLLGSDFEYKFFKDELDKILFRKSIRRNNLLKKGVKNKKRKRYSFFSLDSDDVEEEEELKDLDDLCDDLFDDEKVLKFKKLLKRKQIIFSDFEEFEEESKFKIKRQRIILSDDENEFEDEEMNSEEKSFDKVKDVKRKFVKGKQSVAFKIQKGKELKERSVFSIIEGLSLEEEGLFLVEIRKLLLFSQNSEKGERILFFFK